MKKGFTLVETTVVMAIFAILMVVGTNVIMQVMQASRKAQVENELHQNLSLALETISRQIRKAGCLSVVNNYEELRLYQTTCSGNPYTTFNISGNSVIQDNSTLTSAKVTLDHDDEGTTYPIYTPNRRPTFFSLSPDGRTVRTSLRMSSVGASRWDFAATQIATESTSIRQFSF